MRKNAIMVGPNMMWGTWEELILGGAVLRHGTEDWNVVASELRARTHYPYSFTIQACKAKYEELQRRYSGCTAWFEELRMRRMTELKRELEKSEDSIGSLESRLESLKAENGNYSQVDYGSSRTESPVPLPKTEGIESSGKEISKDGLSAGSFTQDTRTTWSPDFHIAAVASAPKTETKPEVSESCGREKVFSIKTPAETSNEQGGTLRKRRGKRKKKDCSREAKEGSIGESDNLGSTNVATASHWKETSTSDCGHTIRSSGIDDPNRDLARGGSDDLMGIFSSVAENKHALGFRHRLDSQKRARYKKIIRQHMDFDTIRSRIANCSITSARELFRDLLLLTNNALVFYSRRTREYKSALSLRDLVMKAYRHHCVDSGNSATSPILCLSPMCNPPVRPRSVRPRPSVHKLSSKLSDAKDSVAGTPEGYKKPSNADSSTPSLQSWVTAKKSTGAPDENKKLTNADSSILPLQSFVMSKKTAGTPGYKKPSNADCRTLSLQSLVMAKKGFGRPRKIGRGATNQQPKTLIMKERKRARQR